MYFKSKKGIKPFLMFWSPAFLLILFYLFLLKQSILVFVIIALIICLLSWVWFGTGYKIKGGIIKIKSGPFRSTVRIEEIKKLSRSNGSLSEISFNSGPALSTDRLEIFYGKNYHVVNISPKNENDFINTLIVENPCIQVDKNISS